MEFLQDNALILFQGDSITDCGRSREDLNDLGPGYPALVASMLNALCPESDLQFLNRGISGNRTCDLLARWDEDCLDLEPDLLSILIGVNDTWRRFDSNDPTSTEQFEKNYDELLSRTRQRLGDIPILLLEPFLLPEPEDKQCFREDLDPKIHAVRRVARKYNCTYVSLDGALAEATVYQPSEKLSADGVHPTLYGHGIITKRWLEAVGLL